MTGVYLFLVLVALGIAYYLDTWRRPYRDCWSCGGPGSNRRKSVFGNCWVCHGTGRSVRWGVKILHPGMYRGIRNGGHGRNY